MRPAVIDVPGGRVVLGSDTLVESDVVNPPHAVILSPFSLGIHPVTNAEYAAFVAGTSATAPTSWKSPRFAVDDLPVVDVSWDDALAYCTWAGGTLPTEAQWEHAARGGDARRFPWGEAEPDDAHAHFAQDWNSGGPCAIGLHPAGASPFGCQDLAGNVWEWCLDGWHVDGRERRAGKRDPVAPGVDNVRPLRGGCWRSIAPKLQGAYRNWSHRAVRHTTIGFRFCRRS